MQCSLLTNGLFFYPEENNNAFNKLVVHLARVQKLVKNITDFK